MSQLQALCDKLGLTLKCQYGAVEPKDEWQRTAHGYRCTLRYQRRQLTVPFWMGKAHTSEPTTADVLACLCSDASAADASFESWAADMGYDTDSRKAESIYRACCAIAPRLRRFLGDSYDAVCRAEH